MSNDLKFEEFKKAALRTESPTTVANLDVPNVKTLLRLFITVGTLLDYTKKGVFYNKYQKYDENFIELVNGLNDLVLQLAVKETDRKEVSDINLRVFHGLLGSMTESAELGMILLKYLETGEIDKANVAEEYGDGDWYKAVTFDELGLSETVSRQNVIDKLLVRFPIEYTDDAAANRDLDAERVKLEQNI